MSHFKSNLLRVSPLFPAEVDFIVTGKTLAGATLTCDEMDAGVDAAIARSQGAATANRRPVGGRAAPKARGAEGYVAESVASSSGAANN